MKRENLTKENFWNYMYLKFPKAMKLFCEWIDTWKFENDTIYWKQGLNGKSVDIKYHDYPYAMQHGIWIEFVQNTLHKFFEQPEYEPNLDLEEDIKSILYVLEIELNDREG